MKKNNLLIAGAMLLIMTAFSVNKVQAQTCVMPPSCEDLGYKKTESDCAGVDIVLKCPTDMTKMACLGSAVSQDIFVGAILYGDGTVSGELISSKKPIGVVFDAFNRLALSLNYIDKAGVASVGTPGMDWGYAWCDIPSLQNCAEDVYSCAVDGRVNTSAMLTSKEICSTSSPAAEAVTLYQPSGCGTDFCKKGKWFIPSMRDLYSMYVYKLDIESTLQLLSSQGATTLIPPQECYAGCLWLSSNERNESSSWYFLLKSGTDKACNKSSCYGTPLLRPVLAF